MIQHDQSADYLAIHLVLSDTEVLPGVRLLRPGEHQLAQDLRTARLVDYELPARQRLNAPFCRSFERLSSPAAVGADPGVVPDLVSGAQPAHRGGGARQHLARHRRVGAWGVIVCQQTSGCGAIRVICLQAAVGLVSTMKLW